MSTKKKILILSRGAVFQKDILISRSIEIRFLNPLSKMHDLGEIELSVCPEDSIEEDHLRDFDFVFFCRHDSNISLEIHKRCKAHNIKTLYDLDDLTVSTIPAYFNGVGGSPSTNTLEHIKLADYITVENERLASFVNVLKKSIVIPNSIDFNRFSLPYTRIGTKGRIAFVNAALLKIERFKEDWIRLLKKISSDTRFELHIITDTNPDLQNIQGAIYHPSCSWHEHLFKLNLIKPHIGLVPLSSEEDPGLSQFNRCKSVIKYLNYTACGAVGIYSNVEPYSLHITNNVNGLLVENNIEQWFDAIECSMSDSFNRQRMLVNSILDIKKNFDINSTLNNLRSIIGI